MDECLLQPPKARRGYPGCSHAPVAREEMGFSAELEKIFRFHLSVGIRERVDRNSNSIMYWWVFMTGSFILIRKRSATIASDRCGRSGRIWPRIRRNIRPGFSWPFQWSRNGRRRILRDRKFAVCNSRNKKSFDTLWVSDTDLDMIFLVKSGIAAIEVPQQQFFRPFGVIVARQLNPQCFV